MLNQDSSKEAADLARKTAEVQILQRVSADINSTLDLDEICDAVLRTMDELFEFHHASILLLEPDNRTLRVIASRGYENQAIGGCAQVGTGVIGGAKWNVRADNRSLARRSRCPGCPTRKVKSPFRC
jgi:GAF domain-containing protein